MTDISKEILEKYQVRKSKKQKLEFIEFLRGYFPELRVEEGGLGHNRNIVIGDVENAKVVFGAHYDTCAVMPIPNFIMPKNILLSLGYSLILVIPMIIIMMLVGGLVGSITKMPEVASLVSVGVYFLLFGLLIAGPANKHTVNDNTSGVITLVEILQSLTPEQREKAAFVFFDNEEVGLLGSAFFAKKHKEVMKEKLLINFDCVSDGDHIMFVINEKARREYIQKLGCSYDPHCREAMKRMTMSESKKAYYPSDQGNFKVSVGVAAFKQCRFGLYMDRIHTPRDTVMDEQNIKVLVEGSGDFIDNM